MIEIKVFLLVLSIIFLLKNVGVFVFKLFQPEPEPMTLNMTEKILLYLSLTYVITFLILSF